MESETTLAVHAFFAILRLVRSTVQVLIDTATANTDDDTYADTYDYELTTTLTTISTITTTTTTKQY